MLLYTRHNNCGACAASRWACYIRLSHMAASLVQGMSSVCDIVESKARCVIYMHMREIAQAACLMILRSYLAMLCTCFWKLGSLCEALARSFAFESIGITPTSYLNAMLRQPSALRTPRDSPPSTQVRASADRTDCLLLPGNCTSQCPANCLHLSTSLHPVRDSTLVASVTTLSHTRELAS